MKKVLFAFGLIAMSTLPRVVLAGAAYDELNADEQAAIQRGEQVVHEEDIDGAPWPKLHIYQRIAATPEEAAAVTNDFELRPQYTPDCKSAKISKNVDALTTEVDYVIEVPIVSDEHITLSQQMSYNYDGKGSYKDEWKMVRSTKTKQSDGYTRYEPLGTGTLMAVVSFVWPDVWGASMVAGEMTDKMKAATDGFAKWVENERAKNPSLLQKQIDALHKAFGH